MIEARLSVFDRLCRLSGRLDIVLSQLTQHTSRTKAALGKGPKVVSAGTCERVVWRWACGRVVWRWA